MSYLGEYTHDLVEIWSVCEGEQGEDCGKRTELKIVLSKS